MLHCPMYSPSNSGHTSSNNEYTDVHSFVFLNATNIWRVEGFALAAYKVLLSATNTRFWFWQIVGGWLNLSNEGLKGGRYGRSVSGLDGYTDKVDEGPTQWRQTRFTGIRFWSKSRDDFVVGTGRRTGADLLFRFSFMSVATNNGFNYLSICNGAVG